MRGDSASESSGHNPTGSVPIGFSPQLCVGTRRPIPPGRPEGPVEAAEASLPARLQPRESDGHRSRVSGAFAFIAPRPPARYTLRAKAPGPGQAGGAGTGREELTRLRGFPEPAGRARLSAAFPRACSSRQPEVQGAGQRKRAHPSGLTGLGPCLTPPAAAARPPGSPGPRQPPQLRPRCRRRGCLRPPRRPAAPPPPSFPHHYAALRRRRRCRRRARPSLRSRLLPAARRLSGLSRRRARGAGGTQAAASSSPPSPPSSPAPPAGSARRARGSRGALLAAASTTEKKKKKCLGARRGETGRGGRGVARRLEAWPAARSRSLVRSLAHSPRLLSPTAARGLRGCRGRLGGKVGIPQPRGGSHGAGAAAGPARGLLGVHCVRLSVSPRGAGPGERGAGPGERGAWAELRTGGSSGRRGTCAARAVSPPRGRGSPPHPLLPSLDLSPAPR